MVYYNIQLTIASHLLINLKYANSICTIMFVCREGNGTRVQRRMVNSGRKEM